MREAVLMLLLYTFMAWTGKILLLTVENSRWMCMSSYLSGNPGMALK